MENSRISWTDHTFNPWIGCMRVSAGCINCYAEDFVVNRLRKPGVWGPESERWVTSRANWAKPRTWDRRARREGVRQRVFCASLADVFELHPALEAPRTALWELIADTPALDWQLLTKRPEKPACCRPTGATAGPTCGWAPASRTCAWPNGPPSWRPCRQGCASSATNPRSARSTTCH
ncbi:MAG: DUF5131 family protein [Caldilineaceae bacterium]|nr:DUF5131 family protein [Caldilineaceae bacterium]